MTSWMAAPMSHSRTSMPASFTPAGEAHRTCNERCHNMTLSHVPYCHMCVIFVNGAWSGKAKHMPSYYITQCTVRLHTVWRANEMSCSQWLQPGRNGCCRQASCTAARALHTSKLLLRHRFVHEHQTNTPRHRAFLQPGIASTHGAASEHSSSTHAPIKHQKTPEGYQGCYTCPARARSDQQYAITGPHLCLLRP